MATGSARPTTRRQPGTIGVGSGAERRATSIVEGLRRSPDERRTVSFHRSVLPVVVTEPPTAGETDSVGTLGASMGSGGFDPSGARSTVQSGRRDPGRSVDPIGEPGGSRSSDESRVASITDRRVGAEEVVSTGRRASLGRRRAMVAVRGEPDRVGRDAPIRRASLARVVATFDRLFGEEVEPSTERRTSVRLADATAPLIPLQSGDGQIERAIVGLGALERIGAGVLTTGGRVDVSVPTRAAGAGPSRSPDFPAGRASRRLRGGRGEAALVGAAKLDEACASFWFGSRRTG
jgi:hypothetical protein